MLHKTSPFEFKSLDDAGTFEATVAVFNNVDKGGDRILPGAFIKTLTAWKASGDPIPVIFNHDWGTPDAHIGVVDDAMETDKGLYVKGRLDVADNPVAKQVHRLMQRRSLKEFSFGYSVPKGGEKRAKDGANELSQIDLAEVGPTLKGMNPATELHSVKSALGVEEEPRDAEELREAANRAERDVEEARLPPVPDVPSSDDPTPSDALNAAALLAELETVKTQLADVQRELDDLKQKAEVTDKEPKSARSVDPLRAQAEATALEVASGGMSLRKPPTKAPDPEPELIPLRELKQRSRDLMLQVLSGTE